MSKTLTDAVQAWDSALDNYLSEVKRDLDDPEKRRALKRALDYAHSEWERISAEHKQVCTCGRHREN